VLKLLHTADWHLGRGLVMVARDPKDRRNRRLSLTEQGRTTLAWAVPIWERTQDEMDRLLGAGETVDAAGLRKALLALC
jgi:DNA-binding MarR family transcriptional regulator